MLLLLGLVLHLVIPGNQATILERVEFLYLQLGGGPDGEVSELAQNVAVSAFYVVFAYSALSTWLLRATFGQFVTGLRVVQTDYRRATFGQCVGRAVLLTLVMMTYGAAFLSAMRRPGYQAVHDVLSGTIVVRSHAY